ncbi:uncharacterized protein [Nicotiana tomentosiformis]|uniref:uncharacterized protein n=1 Tax=Nicotiana tomentosiformis TaxID=4098 RepID=UPI00388CB3EE
MSVRQSEMRFSELARHAIWLVPTDRERIRRFIDGLTFQLRLLMTRERVSGATFDEVVNIARQIEMVRSQEQVEREVKRSHGSSDFSGVPSGGQFYCGRGRFYKHAQTGRPAHRGASASHGSYSAHSGQSSFSALPPQSSNHASSAQASTSNSSGYQEQQFRQRRGCFECGEFGHFKRDYPRLLSGAPQQSPQLTVPAPAVPPPAQPARGGVLPVCVSTPVSDIITVDSVYRSCVITIGGLETRVDLLLLSMADFDVILGMDWLSSCHAILDCHAKTVTLVMRGLSKVEWRGSLDFVPSRVISYLKVQHMVGKGCLSYLAFVRDIDADTSIIDSVPVVPDFPDVFPADLPGMPPDRGYLFRY